MNLAHADLDASSLYRRVLGKWIKESNLSLRDIAARCESNGFHITSSYISKLRSGNAPPASEMVSTALAQAMNRGAEPLKLAAALSAEPIGAATPSLGDILWPILAAVLNPARPVEEQLDGDWVKGLAAFLTTSVTKHAAGLPAGISPKERLGQVVPAVIADLRARREATESSADASAEWVDVILRDVKLVIQTSLALKKQHLLQAGATEEQARAVLATAAGQLPSFIARLNAGEIS